MRALSRLATVAIGLASLSLFASAAQADEEGVVKRRAEPASAAYPTELEPHFSFGPRNVNGVTGYSGGLRISIPLVVGHLGSVPDNLAISFGGDLLHYENCHYGNNCGANYLLLPIAPQWNVFIARRVNLFGEAGLFVYKGWLTPCSTGDGPGCSAPSNFGVAPTIAIGGPCTSATTSHSPCASAIRRSRWGYPSSSTADWLGLRSRALP